MVGLTWNTPAAGFGSGLQAFCKGDSKLAREMTPPVANAGVPADLTATVSPKPDAMCVVFAGAANGKPVVKLLGPGIVHEIAPSVRCTTLLNNCSFKQIGDKAAVTTGAGWSLLRRISAQRIPSRAVDQSDQPFGAKHLIWRGPDTRTVA